MSVPVQMLKDAVEEYGDYHAEELQADGLWESYLHLLELVNTQQQPTAPKPDWDAAPEWAMWWTVDSDGQANWWEEEPRISRRGSEQQYGEWITVSGKSDWADGSFPDWFMSLQCRPAAEES